MLHGKPFAAITDFAWNCYACAINGTHIVEGRLLFTLALTKTASENDPAAFQAQVFGHFGPFHTGTTSWQLSVDDKLNVGPEARFHINDCTRDFLKLTSTTSPTSYFFIAQKSRGLTSF